MTRVWARRKQKGEKMENEEKTLKGNNKMVDDMNMGKMKILLKNTLTFR